MTGSRCFREQSERLPSPETPFAPPGRRPGQAVAAASVARTVEAMVAEPTTRVPS